jgi:type III pantothenate kinase
MLLVLDAGNTNTVLGVFERSAADGDAAPQYERLLANWRVTTSKTQTVDEYGVLFRNLFSMAHLEVGEVHGIVISSVVPPLDSVLRDVCERYFSLKPLFIEPGVKTGMPVLYDNPAEVGADRIVNAVAAVEKYGAPCIVVDFGTATTFDCVSAKAQYVGGVICPGIGISADALFERTARLPRVDIRKPARVIGSNTVASLRSSPPEVSLRSSAPRPSISPPSTTCSPSKACASSGSGTQRRAWSPESPRLRESLRRFTNSPRPPETWDP